MKRKIMEILVFLLIVFSMAVPIKVEAASAKTYISEIFFSSDEDGMGDCKKDLVAKGVPSENVVDHDFNCNAGGKYIAIGYKTTTNVNDAIRGLLFSGKKVSSITYNGIKYYPLTNASRGGTLDFNQATGKGDDIYLYYSKDKDAGLPITSLGAWCSKHSGTRSEAVKVRNESGEVQDANNGLGNSAYIYLTYGCDEDAINKSIEQSTYKVYEDPNKVPLGKVIYKNWLESNRMVRNWVDVANAINTKNVDPHYGGDSYRMQVGSLVNINNPQMAAAAITSNSNIQNAFSNTDQPTFYLKGKNAGLIFTNFQFVDSAEFFSAAADDVKVGDSLSD